MTDSIYRTINVLCLSGYSQNSTVGTIIDQFKSSDDLAKKFQEAHPIRKGDLMMPECYDTYPKAMIMLDYTLDEAILIYRKLFYSTFEIKPSKCFVKKLIDQMDRSTSKFLDVIVDYGGAFESQHLHLLRCAYPDAIIYSVDVLYEDLDLLICQLDDDESKWCIIPVFSCTNESNISQLIESLRKEIENSSSFWCGLHISKLEFDHTIDHVQIYDPYAEVLNLGKIHFIDTIDKCEIRPCTLFMAYDTYHATPNIDSLVENGLINRGHTVIDLHSHCHSSYSEPVSERTEREILLDNNPKWSDAYDQLIQLRSIVGERPEIKFSLPNNRWKTKLFELTADFHSFISRTSIHQDSMHCIDLSTFVVGENQTNVTSAIVQQRIEQYFGYAWKNEMIHENLSENFSKHFVKECLEEMLGSIKYLHIHIDRDDAIKYAFHFIQQLKSENPTIQFEISFDDERFKLAEKIHQSVIILTIQFNENYVLLHVELECFLQYISTCQSLEDIEKKILSSMKFRFSSDDVHSIKWHRNHSLIYLSRYHGEKSEKIRENIFSKGLNDLIFVTEKFSFLDDYKPPQYRQNQAILTFNFSTSFYDGKEIPSYYNPLNQWIWDESNGYFTGPFVTIYPNVSTYPISTYPRQSIRKKVIGIYNLLYQNVLIMFKWRSFAMWNNRFQ